MSSVLASQLRALSNAIGNEGSKVRKGKASVLYDAAEAADIDLATIYDVGKSGLEQLCRLDARFEPFSRTLFGPSSLGAAADKDAMTPDQVRQLDAQLSLFLRVLSDYLLLPAAFKALEFLVRRYRVHQDLAADLLTCALPYHTSNEFVRIAAIARLEGTPYAFLMRSQETGAAPPRDLVVKRCLGDAAFLGYLCNHAKAVAGAVAGKGQGAGPVEAGPRVPGAASSYGRAFLSFFAVLLSEVLLGGAAGGAAPSEDRVALVMPAVVAGLSREAPEDLAAASLMAAGVLARKAGLARNTVDDLIELVLKCPHASLQPQTLMAADLLLAAAATGDSAAAAALPPAALKAVLRRQGLVRDLEALAQGGLRPAAVVAALSRSLLPAAVETGADEPSVAPSRALLMELVRSEAVGPDAAEDLATLLLASAAAGRTSDAPASALLSALEALHPDRLDKAVNAALGGRGPAPPALLVFLEKSLSGSAMAPLEGAGTTLLAALDHPAAKLRCAALEKLGALYESDGASLPDSSRAQIREAVLRRLAADEDPAVVAAALEHCGAGVVVGELSPREAVNTLLACLDRVGGMLTAPGPQIGDAASAARRCVKLLVRTAAPDADLTALTIPALLTLCLAPTGAGIRKAVLAALSGLATLDSELFGGAEAAAREADVRATAEPETPGPDSSKKSDKKKKKGEEPAPTPKDPASAKKEKKERNKAADVAVSAAVVAGLAASLTASPKELGPRLASYAKAAGPRGRHAALLALWAALTSGKKAPAAPLVSAVLSILRPTWELLAAPEASQPEALSEASLTLKAAGAPAAEHFRILASADRFDALLAATARAALGAALSSATGDDARAYEIFVKVASLAGTSDVLDTLLSLAASSAAMPPAALLARLFTPSSAPLAVRTRALAVLTARCKGLEGFEAAGDVSAALVPLLAAACDPRNPQVRSGAADCLEAVKAGAEAGNKSGCEFSSGLPAAAVAALLSSLLGSRSVWLSDPSHLVAAVKEAATEASGAPTPASTKKGKKASAGAPSGGQPLVDLLLGSLSGGATDSPAPVGSLAAAVNQFVLEVLDGLVPEPLLLARAQQALASSLVSRGDGGAAMSSVLPQLMRLVTPEAVQGLEAQGGDRGALLASILGAMAPGAAPAVVLQVLSRLGQGLWSALAEADRTSFLSSLLALAAEEGDEVRHAARSCLAALPVSASEVAPLIRSAVREGAAAPGAAPTPASSKKAKKAAGAAPAVSTTPTVSLDTSSLVPAERVLELLSWKENVASERSLIPHLTSLVEATLGELGPNNRPDEAAVGAGQIGFLLQLALSALGSICRRGAGADAVSFRRSAPPLPLVLRAAKEAPDAASRNASLDLLCLLASLAPEEALSHVSAVLAVAGESAAALHDAHSQQVASRALAAVVPAWVAANGAQGLPALLDKVIMAVRPAAAHHRAPLLRAALEGVLKELDAGAMACVRLLAAGAPSAGGNTEDLARVASQLVASMAPVERTRCLMTVLSLGTERAASTSGPAAELVVLTTAFVADELPRLRPSLRSLVTGTDTSPDADAARASLEASLATAVDRMLLLGAEGAKTEAGSREARAIKAASDGMAAVLEALRSLTDAAGFLSSLVRLVEGAATGGARRRALQLFAERVKSVGIDIESQAEFLLLSSAKRTERAALAADAAGRVCRLLPPLMDGRDAAAASEASGPTRQAALVVLDTVARRFGAEQQAAIIACVPAALTCLSDSRLAVRGSTFACLASVAVSLGPRALPIIPQAVPGILKGATNAVNALSDTKASADASLELAAALAAVESLVDSIGTFISPQLPAILSLVLDPRVQGCRVAGCSGLAEAVRRRLPSAVPARLLLPAISSQIGPSLDAGHQAARALLDVLAGTAQAMDSKAAAAHADEVFSALLRALDARCQRPAGLEGHVGHVEGAAVTALVALVMKLSESRFKPLFLRLLEWASAPLEVPAKTARSVTLFRVSTALCGRLRSVFVPYFKYLLESILEHLSGGAPAADGRKKKKAKVAVDLTDLTGHALEDSWQLRLHVLRSLQACFLYDTVGFLDAARFERILPLVIAQLEEQPPADVLDVMASEEEGAGVRTYSDHQDTFGRAATETLVQMAVTAGSDALWKPLNHQALMKTRSPSLRTRLLAVDVAEGLAERLREEYLVLLPETLPFVSELLEDPEVSAQAAAQRLIKSLEALSGESLESYLH